MKKLIIIDISNFIFRAFYAIRPLSAPDGTPVNALSGVGSMLAKMIQDHAPSHVIVANDTPVATMRKQKYPEYKATRKEPPSDLQIQFPLINQYIDLLGLKRIYLPGYEADDIIATAVNQFSNDFDKILIASSDKDLMQLVNEKVSILDTRKDVIYNPAKVEEKLGLPPFQVLDYLSILGDSSDNIPGIKGIGEKGAANLLKEFKTLDGIYTNIDQVKSEGLRKKLLEGQNTAYKARDLISLYSDAPLDMKVEEAVFQAPADSKPLYDFLENLGFKTLQIRLKQLFNTIN